MKNRRSKSRRRANESIAERRGRKTVSHVLDVKVKSRRDKKKRSSPQSVLWVKIVIGMMAGAALIIGLHNAARAYLIDNPEYTLHTITYETDGMLTRQRVLDHLELETGGKLLEIRLPDLRRNLLSMPEIKEAQVKRDLPDKISIFVNERTPIAWLACRARGVVPKTVSREDLDIRGLMVDEAGTILECRRLLPRYISLPVIQLRDLGESRPGHRLQPAQAMSAIELILACEDSLYLESLKIVNVDLITEYSLLATFNSGAEVTFGMGNLGMQVNNFRLIHADSVKSGRQLRTVNLLMKKNIPVTFREEEMTPERIEEVVPIPPPRARVEAEDVSLEENRRAPRIRRSIPKDRAENAEEFRAVLRTG